ncbi:hypothetical protein A2V49_03435 [candidate division WWE3 bacterium RBG_19FT_COMBO_34_6]|uniref:Uncharacterized protein n=1 Tax=candidate division WWE3 bacterium RBG_19FT_COMBO_34_6 TaxID=1802612 RepID=A0A1F4UKS0_UNCKA|nr:MAG: hypothetical protein A2V49_03435 [candidate division WWE3 bacterium RBG_19FT_COMBO_34_6]
MAATVTSDQFEILKVTQKEQVLIDFFKHNNHIPTQDNDKKIHLKFPHYPDLDITIAGYTLLNERWYAVIRTKNFKPETFILKPLSKERPTVFFFT